MGRIQTSSRFAAVHSRRAVLRSGAMSGIGIAGLATLSCTPSSVAPPAPTTAPAAGSAATTVAATVAPAPAQPKYGGTVKGLSNSSEAHLDVHMPGGSGSGIRLQVCYSQLLAYKWGKEFVPPSFIVGPDLAESWSQPDDLTYIFKLRPGAKWHNIAPVNGREATAEDVVYSYQRIRDLKSYAANLGGVAQLEAVDKNTFRMTLERPNADILGNLCLTP